MYYVYVLYSEKFNKIYIGYSSDLQKRLDAHNDERNTGWTSRFKPWKIVHSEKYENKSEALCREKQLKTSRGRDYLWKLIEN